jgi:hypothetical protein
MGTKTMQMASVETSAGVAICAAPSRMACSISLPGLEVAVDVLDFDGGVVDQDADGQRQPPRVMMLMVSCSAPSTISEQRIESGMETAMMMVERQAAEKDQNHDGGEAGGDDRLAHHAADGARTKID